MITFVSLFALAYVASTLLVSAAGHLLAFVAFRDTVRAHAIVPARPATPVALAVTLFELGAGATAVVLAAPDRAAPPPAALLLTATALAGTGFAVYVRRLLVRSPAIGCGCSPLAAPTTPASLVPGVALALVSAGGMAAILIVAAAPSAATDLEGGLGLLPRLWGLTLALAVMLLPASIPSPTRTERPA